MSLRILSMTLIACGFAVLSFAADVKDDAIKKDRQLIAGTWRGVALIVNGNPGGADDVKKITVVNGNDGTWTLMTDGKEVAKGTSTIDPTLKPKTIDFTPADGDSQGQKHLGIYELGEQTRKLCFAPPGKDRPKTFEAPEGSEFIFITFERVKPK